MSEKRKSASPSAIQEKNRRNKIGIEKKLRIIMRRDKGDRIVYIRRSVILAHGIVHKICDYADIIKESAQSGTKEHASVA
jgi:hypothetical protein